MYHIRNVQKCTLLVEVMIMQLFLVRPVFFKKKILVRSCVLYKSRKQQCGLGVYAPQMHKSPAFSFINNFFNWQILILQRCYQNKILTCSSKYAANFELHLSRLSYFSLVRRVHCKTSVLITICSILSLG